MRGKNDNCSHNTHYVTFASVTYCFYYVIFYGINSTHYYWYNVQIVTEKARFCRENGKNSPPRGRGTIGVGVGKK